MVFGLDFHNEKNQMHEALTELFGMYSSQTNKSVA